MRVGPGSEIKNGLGAVTFSGIFFWGGGYLYELQVLLVIFRHNILQNSKLIAAFMDLFSSFPILLQVSVKCKLFSKTILGTCFRMVFDF
jgi:hypothetical protein